MSMADNGMVIVCNICHPVRGDWKYGDGVFYLAKYLYSIVSKPIDRSELADWLRRHLHGVAEYGAMPTHFSLQFETNPPADASISADPTYWEGFAAFGCGPPLQSVVDAQKDKRQSLSFEEFNARQARADPSPAPAVLGISVCDSVNPTDKFGG